MNGPIFMLDQYELRRLFVQSITPDSRFSRVSSMGNDDVEDPHSGYCLDAPEYLLTGGISKNLHASRPCIGITTRAKE